MARISEVVPPGADVRGIRIVNTVDGDYYTVRSYNPGSPYPWKLLRECDGRTAIASDEEDEWALYEKPAVPTAMPGLAAWLPAKCSCDIHLLMREGCKCNAIQQERMSKVSAVAPPAGAEFITLGNPISYKSRRIAVVDDLIARGLLSIDQVDALLDFK